MEQFNNPLHSHQHSLEVLNLINQYDEFMESVTSIADFGCGAGYDINWWSRLEYTEYVEDKDGNVIGEVLRKRNYRCYAVDRNVEKIDAELLPTVHVIPGDIEKRQLLSAPVDVVWCHNVFQYFVNPINTLALINKQMVENGMLYIGFPAQTGHVNNRWVNRGFNHTYFNHNIISLMYMLAVNGFDCKDAYFKKELGNPWIHAVVYKTAIEPMDPTNTTWYDLVDKGLVNESVKNSLTRNGYVSQEEMMTLWLDRQRYFVKD